MTASQFDDVYACMCEFDAMPNQPTFKTAIAGFGMKLKRQSRGADGKGLLGAGRRRGKVCRAFGVIECVRVPMEHMGAGESAKTRLRPVHRE